MAYVRLTRMCFSGEAAHTPSLSQELQEAKQRSEDHVLRSEIRGGPGSARSQGEEGGLSVHQGLPIPEQRGPHEGLNPP